MVYGTCLNVFPNYIEIKNLFLLIEEINLLIKLFYCKYNYFAVKLLLFNKKILCLAFFI